MTATTRDDTAAPPLPAFAERNKPVVFASDDNYAPVLAVAAASLLANASPACNYDLLILADSFSAANRRRLLELARNNVSVRLVDMAAYLRGRDLAAFYISGYVGVATYYRFFLPELLVHYDKALYLDCDLAILGDVSELFALDLGDNLVAATTDLFMPYGVEANARAGSDDWQRYLRDGLGLARPERYFQAGVLLLNLDLMRREDLYRRCLAKLAEVPTPRHWDQCILNAVCQGRVLPLPPEWNFLWEPGYAPDMTPERFREGLPPERRADYDRASADPRIVHYCSGTKVWHRPDLLRADHFWRYARQSPAYEEILGRLIRYRAGEGVVRAAADPAGVFAPRIKANRRVEERHGELFPRFRGVHRDREVAVVATGPSLARYRRIPGAVHIGVNRAFLAEDVGLDYLFVQDFSGIETVRGRLAERAGEGTVKFFGLPAAASGLDWRRERVPEGFETYYCLEGASGKPMFLAADIDRLPLACNGSVVFSALQFALYTRPKRLYLVGCDATGKGNLETGQGGGFGEDRIVGDWKQFKAFAERQYPDTEIVSVNPVRLAGLFKDRNQ